jgi:uncharacterized membrane protein
MSGTELYAVTLVAVMVGAFIWALWRMRQNSKKFH